MRVAMFFDGKNFYSGWRDVAGSPATDFVKLSQWLVSRVGGSRLWGAYYYTGVEASGANTKLGSFLDGLEHRPGFFVNRFPRKIRTTHCVSCNAENTYTEEKEVDTTMVADMLRLAAVDAFDVMILMSGDADHAPAVEGVRALGKQAYVATWGGKGLASRLRRVAFDHIDLMNSISETRYVKKENSEFSGSGQEDGNGDSDEDIFLDELERAEKKMVGGWVGANYFITKWRADNFTSSVAERRQILSDLEKDGLVEVYETESGDKAIRIVET